MLDMNYPFAKVGDGCGVLGLGARVLTENPIQGRSIPNTCAKTPWPTNCHMQCLWFLAVVWKLCFFSKLALIVTWLCSCVVVFPKTTCEEPLLPAVWRCQWWCTCMVRFDGYATLRERWGGCRWEYIHYLWCLGFMHQFCKETDGGRGGGGGWVGVGAWW